MKAIRVYVVFFVIILSTRAGYSQPWYFNNLFNPNNTWSAGLSITSNSEGYMGCAITGDQYNFYQISLLDLQNDGTIIDFKNYGQYGRDFWPGENGSFKRDNQNNYYLYGTVDNLNYIVNGLFISFNSDGDTIFSRKYESLYTTRLAGRNCIQTFDNGFILTGDENITDSSGVDFYIIKIDSAGSEKWRNHYGMNIGDVPYSIVQTPDSGYVIGGLTFSGPQITYDPLVIKTDNVGELEWMLNLGGVYKDDKAMVCNTSDSCILVLTAYADSMRTPEHAYTKINLIKIGLNGETIWNKKYGPSKPVNYISNIKTTPNGNYILCGYSMLDTYLPSAGWIMEVDSEGDSIWYKDYYYFPLGYDYPHNYLYDISQTDDNGIIATGQAFTFDPPNNVQKMWMIKLDSIGCEIPNCWVGIEEEEETVGQGEEGKRGELVVWPNPASGVLSVKCLGLSSGSSCLFSVFDIFGRPASIPGPSPIWVKGEEASRIDISSLPPGIYFISVLEDGKRVAGGKFVVAR